MPSRARGGRFRVSIVRPPGFPNFHPVRVVDQVAAALREAIKKGVWGHHLPGEHELSRQLGVSRPTVHAALLTLKANGLIATSQGSRTRILARVRRSDFSPRVCVVAPASREHVGLAENPLLLGVRTELTALGVGWEEVFDTKLAGRSPERRLEKLVSERRCVCWLLVVGSAPMQRWFEKVGVPTLVLGSCHPGVRLPSVDCDYLGIARHAAGCVTQRGHRHIALVLKDRPLPGDLACRDGFARYLKLTEAANSLTIVTAGADGLELQSKLERLLAHRPRPTVVFAMHAQHIQALLVHLPRLGFSIPKDISLLAGETHPLFELSFSDLTRYQTATEKTIRHVVRVVQSLLAGHRASLKPFLATPTFVAGKTLSRIPSTSDSPA